MKQIFALFFLSLGFVASSIAQNNDKQKVYTLKKGETLMTFESSLGVANTADGYVFLVEKAPKDEGTLPEYHVITPKKSYGPFGGIIPNSFSPDGKWNALCVSDYMPQYAEDSNPSSQVIFNDGTVKGPFKGYTNVLFSADNSEWVITSDVYNGEGNSKTTLQFKGGDPIYSDAAEYVSYAPKGTKSARVKTYSRPDGIYLSEYFFSDGKKVGPVEPMSFEFSADGNSYGILGRKNGKMYVIVNGVETQVSDKANTLILSEDASDWAIMTVEDDNSGNITFRNGKKTEMASYILSGSLFYFASNKEFGWMTSDNKRIFMNFSGGKEYGPIELIPNPPVQESGDGTVEENSYYASGSVFFNDKKNKWIATIYTSDGTGYVHFDGKNIQPLKTEMSLVLTAFDANDVVYYVTEKEVVKEGQEYSDFAYTLVYPETGKSTKLPSYPSDLKFLEGSNIWYMSSNEGELVFSDGTRFPNAFGIRYEKTEGKLYWLTLEGQDIFLNKKRTR